MTRRPGDQLLPFRPDVDGPWDAGAAAHLVKRACFGGTPAEVLAVVAKGPNAVDQLTRPVDRAADPDWADACDISERAAKRQDIVGLRAAWFHRFVAAERPFVERLALFWHDHFATSDAKVRNADDMYRQNVLFSTRGAGEFGGLLHAIARDPAMIRWLDGDTNVKGIPNENFARELFELFALGIGNYAEADIRESARAFTGWRTDGHSFRIDPAAHDDGQKSVFRHSIESGDDVIELCLARRECRRFIAVKLCREFVTTDISDELAEALAGLMGEVHWNIHAFLCRLLASRLFYSAEARGALFRSPVAFMVGLVRTLGTRVNAGELAERAADMSQNLFMPPSVKGFDKGRAWITTATLASRRDFAAEVKKGAHGALKLQWRSDTAIPADHLTRMLTIDSPKAAAPIVGASAIFERAAELLETPGAHLF